MAVIDKLQRLAQRHAAGELSDAEFTRARKKLLAHVYGLAGSTDSLHDAEAIKPGPSQTLQVDSPPMPLAITPRTPLRQQPPNPGEWRSWIGSLSVVVGLFTLPWCLVLSVMCCYEGGFIGIVISSLLTLVGVTYIAGGVCLCQTSPRALRAGRYCLFVVGLIGTGYFLLILVTTQGQLRSEGEPMLASLCSGLLLMLLNLPLLKALLLTCFRAPEGDARLFAFTPAEDES